MELSAGTGINDMRYYNFQGIPTGCYGAAGGNGHAADEWLDLRSMAPTAKVLGAFILDCFEKRRLSCRGGAPSRA